jgi:tRNA G18 (ribose-2'-O)-methylase SpoU
MGKRRQRSRTDKEQALWLFRKHRNANLSAVPGVFPSIVVLDHLKPNYNIGKIFRSADAFGVHEIHLVGIDFFDPTTARGSFKWVPARFHDTFDACYRELNGRGYTLFTLEPVEGELITSVDLPLKSAFVFGHEEFGISFDKGLYGNIRTLNIPQFGKVQSLNVSVAASLVMYEYVRRRAADQQ